MAAYSGRIGRRIAEGSDEDSENRWMVGRSDGRTDGQPDGRMDKRSDGRTDRRSDGRTVGWTDGRMVGWSGQTVRRRRFLFLAAYTLRIAPGSTFGVLECVGVSGLCKHISVELNQRFRDDTHVWCVCKGKGATKTIQSKYEKINFS